MRLNTQHFRNNSCKQRMLFLSSPRPRQGGSSNVTLTVIPQTGWGKLAEGGYNHQFLAGKQSIPSWEVFAPTEKASYICSSGCTTSATSVVPFLEEVSLSLSLSCFTLFIFFASRRRLVSVWCSQTSSAGIHMVKHLALYTTKCVQRGANILASLWHVCPCGVRTFVIMKIPLILLPTSMKTIIVKINK